MRTIVRCAIALTAACATSRTTAEPIAASHDPLALPDYGVGDVCGPRTTDIYNRTAYALSRLQTPEFTPDEQPLVLCAFNAAFDGGAIRPQWVAALTARIHVPFTQGWTKMVPDDQTYLPRLRVRGHGAYFMLAHGGRSEPTVFRHIFIGPYPTPVVFVD
ncbi:hypothetical protein HY480_03070 [Candidatus Uhrbacteria bacterium]|nr:hypothetical protein [Candidatus Uhrbacteria bacterium]